MSGRLLELIHLSLHSQHPPSFIISFLISSIFLSFRQPPSFPPRYFVSSNPFLLLVFLSTLTVRGPLVDTWATYSKHKSTTESWGEVQGLYGVTTCHSQLLLNLFLGRFMSRRLLELIHLSSSFPSRWRMLGKPSILHRLYLYILPNFLHFPFFPPTSFVFSTLLRFLQSFSPLHLPLPL